MNATHPTKEEKERDIYKLVRNLEKRIEMLESELLAYKLMNYGIIVHEPVPQIPPWSITWTSHTSLIP